MMQLVVFTWIVQTQGGERVELRRKEQKRRAVVVGRKRGIGIIYIHKDQKKRVEML